MSCLPNPVSLISQKSLHKTCIKHSSSFSMSTTTKAMAKELYFNHDGLVTKKLQAGVNLVGDLLGVTLGPKGRNVVLPNKYGPPKIVNDGETVLKEIELEDPLENVGVKLVRQAGAKTNDLAGDGSTTSIVLARGLIDEGVKVIAAGRNPIQISRGIEKTATALVSQLKLMSREIEDHEIADVAAVSAGNDYVVGNMIAEALEKVGRKGVVRTEKGSYTENRLQVVEGMQFDRGYLSPYFVTDRRKMTVEYENCKILLVDKKITHPKEVFRMLENAVKGDFPILIVAEGIEKEALAPIIRNKLKGALKAVAIKAPAFGERKSHSLDDIAILTRGTVIRDELGLNLEKVGMDVLGTASKVVITSKSTLIVTDGSTREAVDKRVSEIKAYAENVEENFQRKILHERIARLSGGIAIIEVGAEIFRRALAYPIRKIAENAGVSGSVVIQKVLANDNLRYGYNAANDCYQDLMEAGIIDPTKVVRCCLEHAASVANTFLTSDILMLSLLTFKKNNRFQVDLQCQCPCQVNLESVTFDNCGEY